MLICNVHHFFCSFSFFWIILKIFDIFVSNERERERENVVMKKMFCNIDIILKKRVFFVQLICFLFYLFVLKLNSYFYLFFSEKERERERERVRERLCIYIMLMNSKKHMRMSNTYVNFFLAVVAASQHWICSMNVCKI